MKKLFIFVVTGFVFVSLTACTTTGTSDTASTSTGISKRVQKKAEPANYDLSKAGVGVIADVF